MGLLSQDTLPVLAPKERTSPAIRHIVVFEPEADGHQMEHLRYLLGSIDTLVTNTRVTLLTTESAAKHPNCQRLAALFRHMLSLRIVPPVTKGHYLFRGLGVFYERQWRHAEALARGLDEIGEDNVDFVILPHLESIGLLQLVLRPHLFHGKPWATIAISIRFHHRAHGIGGPASTLDALQRAFFKWIIRDPDLACFGTVNPWLAPAIRHPKVALCPEPSAQPILCPIEEARRAYGLRLETCVIVVFGIIDRRKCIDILLESVARLVPSIDLTVLLAGPQHHRHLAPALNGEAARSLRDQGRLVEMNRFILNDQDIDPINAADISWVFYERRFVNSSSVLVRSALARRPVIARRQGVIGRLVDDHALGLTVDNDSPEAVAAALARLAGDPALRERMGDNGARAFAHNTPERFARPIVDGINRAFADRRQFAAAD